MKMLRIIIGLLLLCMADAVRGQDADHPLSLAEMKQFDRRVSIRRLDDVKITHPNVYTMKMRQERYPADVEEIVFDVTNTDAPRADLGNGTLMQLSDGGWKRFPVKENIAITGIGRTVSKGATLDDNISMWIYKEKPKPGRYRVDYYVTPDIYTLCAVSDSAVRPVGTDSVQGALVLKVLPSGGDSIRIVLENHTNLTVIPRFLPSIRTDSQYVAHPYARGGSNYESRFVQQKATLRGGETVMFTYPTTWDARRISGKYYREIFAYGRLAPGIYKIGMELEAEIKAEFDFY